MKYSITKRLFMGVFMLILPLLLLQSAIYVWSHRTVTQEISGTARGTLEYLHSYLEQSVQDVYDAANILLTETTVGQFYTNLAHDTFDSVSQYYMDMRDMRTTLGIQKYSNELVKEVTLCFPQHGLMLDSYGAYTLDGTWLNALLEAAQEQNSHLLETNGTLYTLYHWTQSMKLENAPLLLCVELNQGRLEALLSSYSETNEKSSYLLNAATQHLVKSENAADVTAAELKPLLDGLHGAQVRQQSLTAGGVSYEAFVCYSSYLDYAIIQLIPSATFHQIPSMIGALLLLLCAATVIVLINLLGVLRRTVGRPVDGLLNAFASAGQGDFKVRLPRQDAQEFDQLAAGFNAMAQHIDTLLDTNYRQTIRLQTAELKQLQAQINPHFLYNSFYFLRHLVATGDNDTAEEFCRYLGQYFQYITRSDNNTLPLRQEYDHAVSYLNIQLMRFGDTVEADIAPIPAGMAELVVPRLIVEPVVENCFKYGLNTTDTTGCIRMSFEEYADTACVVIENNGNDLTDQALQTLRDSLNRSPEDASFTGLVNTHHRLRYFFGGAAGVEVGRSPLGGLLVRLVLTRQPINDEKGALRL